MKSKTKKLILIPTLILFLIILIPFSYIKIYLNVLEHRVVNYLIDEKGYQKEDILNVEGAFGKLPLFGVWVIFKDEPNIKYLYVDRDPVIQVDHTLSDQGLQNNLNPFEIKVEELKHYDWR